LLKGTLGVLGVGLGAVGVTAAVGDALARRPQKRKTKRVKAKQQQLSNLLTVIPVPVGVTAAVGDALAKKLP